MNAKDLRILEDMPFLFWVKDDQGRYRWGNRTIMDAATEDIVGKTDAELRWANSAAALRADDQRVFETGEPLFVRELADNTERGTVELSVCKFIGEFEGERCVFGVSFVIE